jgi:hypothetical protein
MSQLHHVKQAKATKILSVDMAGWSKEERLAYINLKKTELETEAKRSETELLKGMTAEDKDKYYEFRRHSSVVGLPGMCAVCSHRLPIVFPIAHECLPGELPLMSVCVELTVLPIKLLVAGSLNLLGFHFICSIFHFPLFEN